MLFTLAVLLAAPHSAIAQDSTPPGLDVRENIGNYSGNKAQEEEEEELEEEDIFEDKELFYRRNEKREEIRASRKLRQNRREDQ